MNALEKNLPPETVRLFIRENKFINVCKVLTVEGLRARAAALNYSAVEQLVI